MPSATPLPSHHHQTIGEHLYIIFILIVIIAQSLQDSLNEIEQNFAIIISSIEQINNCLQDYCNQLQPHFNSPNIHHRILNINTFALTLTSLRITLLNCVSTIQNLPTDLPEDHSTPP